MKIGKHIEIKLSSFKNNKDRLSHLYSNEVTLYLIVFLMTKDSGNNILHLLSGFFIFVYALLSIRNSVTITRG